MRAEDLRVEYLTEPIGLDVTAPRFSWIVTSDRRGDRQTAYQVVVDDVWDSGRVLSSETAHVVYEGPPLESDRTYRWSVRVWDDRGEVGEWAAKARWDTGLLDEADWSASWVSAPESARTPANPPEGIDFAGRTHRRPAWLRGSLRLAGRPARARAFVTARGVYELHVNGARAGRDVFTPGWTDYSQRIQYQAYDVTDLLREGDNTVAALVGDGWFSGRIAWQQEYYGDHPSLLAQLHVDLEDGTEVCFGTDATWEAAPSELLWSDMLTGEGQVVGAVVDGWTAVELESAPAAALVGQRGPTVRTLDSLPAQSVTEVAPGRFVVDFGQNLVGWVRIELPSPEGARLVTVRHAEMLEPDGSLYTANYRGAQCVDAYAIEPAHDPLVLEPHFTWRGFRYAEIDGLPAGAAFTATGVVLGSDTPVSGSFECSVPMVNQLQRNVEWGQRGNFLEVPTDCPQRDERLGWMGDAQVFIPTACWNADVAAFFTKWLDDVLDACSPEGAFADIAPLVREELFAQASPAWGDAGVIVPWVLYERYGDTRILEHCFDAMAGWVEYIRSANPDLLWRRRRNNDYGDWLSVGEDTPRDVLSTAYFARSASLVARAARVIDRKEDAAHHEQLFAAIKAAFCEAYVAPSGRIVGHTQTAYVLAIAFDLLPEELVAPAAGFLAELITERRGFKSDFTPGHLATGFLGVGEILPVLAEHGHLDLAYRLLENDTFPSWGYSIRHGATTIWERWDGWTDTRGFQDPGMNSFNHYSLGSVGHWLYSTVAGIKPEPEAPAFERFTIRPRPGGSLRWARASHRSLRGTIESAWRIEGDAIELRVTVPANTSADVWVPRSSVASLREGGRPVAEAPGVEAVGDRDGCAVVRVGGGTFVFTA